jgi:hypothetical protein
MKELKEKQQQVHDMGGQVPSPSGKPKIIEEEEKAIPPPKVVEIPSTSEKKSLKIVCISDTHGKHRNLKVPDGDVLVHAGDITSKG